MEVYERYHIPAPGSWVWGGVLANFTPGHQATWVDYDNDERAPLLFIAGEGDHIMPAAVNKSNSDKYARLRRVTEYSEFPGGPTSLWGSRDGKRWRTMRWLGVGAYEVVVSRWL